MAEAKETEIKIDPRADHVNQLSSSATSSPSGGSVHSSLHGVIMEDQYPHYRPGKHTRINPESKTARSVTNISSKAQRNAMIHSLKNPLKADLRLPRLHRSSFREINSYKK